jgi:protocatechuate 3,4-dioxygenase beta subunit
VRVGDTLERNLARLLPRAYHPLPVRPEFREQLARSFVGGVRARAAERLSADAAPGPQPGRAWPWLAPLATAAAAAVLAWFAVRASDVLGPAHPGGGADPARERTAAAAPVEGVGGGDGASVARPAQAGAETVPLPLAVAESGAGPRRVAAADDPSVGAEEPVAAPVGARLRLRVTIDGPRSAEEPREEPVVAAAVDRAELTVTLLRVAQVPDVAEPTVLPLPAAGGALEWADLPEGRHALFVRQAGFATGREVLELRAGSPCEVEVRLERGHVLRGQVLDGPGGTPVAGALVLSETDVPLQVLSAEPPELEAVDAVYARSGPDGRFELGPLRGGEQVLRATAPGRAPAWLRATAEEEPAELRFELGRSGAIHGRVLDGDGTRVEGAIVLASLYSGAAGGAQRFFAVTLTDGEGRYRLEDLPAGFFVVLWIDGATEALRSATPVPLTSGAERQVDFGAAPRAASISGRLLDADGLPLAEQWVTVSRLDLPEGGSRDDWSAVPTDADGRFAARDLEPGRYGLYSGRANGIEMSLRQLLEVREGERHEVELTLTELGLRLQLVAAQGGEPQAGAAVLMREEADGTAHFAGRARVTEDGRLEFVGLGPGTYRLHFFPSSAQVASAVALPFEASADPAVQRIELAPAGSLAVHCTAPDGAPLAAVRLELRDGRGRWLLDDGDLRSDGAGRLAVTSLEPGPWLARFTHPDHGVHEVALTLTAGETCAVEVALPAGLPAAPR